MRTRVEAALLQFDSASQTGRPGANHDDVELLHG